MIFDVWNSTFISNLIENNDKENIIEPNRYEHLTAILNLLHMYNEICPKLLDVISDMQCDTFLNILNKLKDINVIELNIIKVKAIHFLVILYPYEFFPHKVCKIIYKSLIISFFIFINKIFILSRNYLMMYYHS